MGAAGLLTILAVAACRATTREPAPSGGRPDTIGEATRRPPSEVATDSGRARYTEADVQFMQRMMAHHGQALTMTSMVPTRTNRDDIRLLAQRIEISQRDEMASMRRWLEARGETAPSLDADHGPAAGGGGGHHSLMPGMLTGAELAQLAKATGAEFDRLFLQDMIRHHEGALTMVREFFATHGAGQEPEIFRFASEVDADQRAEIRRMRTMQTAPPSGVPRR